jgi:hypothetical protein
LRISTPPEATITIIWESFSVIGIVISIISVFIRISSAFAYYLPKEFIESLKSMHPIGRIADPEAVANAVVWLLSDKPKLTSALF